MGAIMTALSPLAYSREAERLEVQLRRTLIHREPGWRASARMIKGALVWCKEQATRV